MRLKVRCPVCEKSVRVSEADAGQQALCPACGARFDVPRPPLLGDASLAPAGPAAVGAEDDVEVEVAAGGNGAGSRETGAAGVAPLDATTAAEVRAILEARAGESKHLHPAWWLTAGVAVSALVLLVVVALARRGDTWDQDHRAEVVAMKSKAEALAAAGQVREAHQQYLELDKLIGGRTVRDPELRAMVDLAHAEQEKIYHAILASVLSPTKEGRAPATSQSAVAATLPAGPAAPSGAALASAGGPGFIPAGPGEGAGGATDPRPGADATTPKPAEPANPTPPAPASPAPPPAPVAPQRPVARPVPDDPDVLTDERIGESIQKGVNYLLSRFDSSDHVLRESRDYDGGYFCGEDSLAVYALLQCGEAISDPRLNVRGTEMKALIDAMKKLKCDRGYQTYARGIRATALALFDRPEDLAALRADARWLVETCDEGAYTYSNRPLHTGVSLTDGWFNGPPRGAWDNSNSQYGLLGVWSAVEAEPRIEVPAAYWKAVQRHWTECQAQDGEWGYTHGNGRISMTCAGLASLLVAHEYLEPAMAGGAGGGRPGGAGPTTTEAPVGREPFTPALKKGLDWFEEEDHSVSVDGGHWGYNLYGVERVGLASGFKFFGTHDWYRELAGSTVARQRDSGSWGDGVIDTSYALLFLARGRHPILMNKLRFDGYWANRPRDAANLARYAGRQLERPLNWQIINIKSPWTEWTDSPVLYLASHTAPKLSDEEVNSVRNFVLAGGLLFTHADQGSAAFNAFAADLAHRLFKDYELADLPPGHLIYNVNFKPDPRPPLKYVTNGARVLMVHSPTDLATHWQKREDRPWEAGGEGKADPGFKARQLAPFQLGANLFIYAAGKRDLHNRLQTAWVTPPDAPPSATTPSATVKVARLQYAGNWDPEPFAWRRYAHWFQRQTGYKLDVQTVPLKDLKPSDAPLAHLTGTARTVFTAAEAAAVKAYVGAGGVLLIDMCGGTGAFDQALPTSLLNPAFPNADPSAVAASHPLLRAGAPGTEDLSRARLRPFAVERLGRFNGLPTILPFGKGHVLATNLDLTCGLLGTDTWGIIGYDPAYAQSLVKNVLFWALDGQPDQ